MTCRHTMQGPVIGHQDDGADGFLELRNCVTCRSTVSAEVTRAWLMENLCRCATCRGLAATKTKVDRRRVPVAVEFAVARARLRERRRLWREMAEERRVSQ